MNPPHKATTRYLDYRSLDWSRIVRVQHGLEQSFTYTYPGAIEHLNHRLTIIPKKHAFDQYLLDYRFTVTPPVGKVVLFSDSFGNSIFSVKAPRVETSITFSMEASIERRRKGLPEVAAKVGEHLGVTHLTEPDGHIERMAKTLRDTALDEVELAENICQWVYRNMRYGFGETDVSTPANRALTIGTGLCQDYSHIMLALCHAAGLCARYVSGHMLAEGGSHAWVEVLLPTDRRKTLEVHAFDPTNGCRPGLNYITIAVGRDYYDVAPTAGTYNAPYAGDMSFSKSAGLTLVEYEDGEVLESA